MQKKVLLILVSIWTALVASQFSGCASGGFKWTRTYARWVNSNHIVLRIVLYVLTSVVFAVTLLFDMVIFNTLDFWNGTVAKGTYEFKDGDKTYVVTHDIQNGLRSSFIKITDNHNSVQTVEIRENSNREIEFYQNGTLQAKGVNLSTLPKVVIYNLDGKTVASESFILDQFSKLALK
jgi:hypothetical protein